MNLRAVGVGRCVALLALLGLAGCDDGSTGADAGVPGGSGTIAGTLSGRPFETVAASYLAGRPDDADRTLVIYVFDEPVPCALLGDTGWDFHIGDGTQVLEMKVIGKAPGTYPITVRPSAGQADVNYTVSATRATPSEVRATSGEVRLTEVVEGATAAGTFDLTFPGGTVTGAFSAAFCDDAREP